MLILACEALQRFPASEEPSGNRPHYVRDVTFASGMNAALSASTCEKQKWEAAALGRRGSGRIVSAELNLYKQTEETPPS